MFKKLRNDERAFTGLEAAIVLTAFVVVAAVFSYVVLGAGFYTSDAAKQTIHTGVEQATSSIEMMGDVIAKGDGTVDYILLTLQTTAGNSPTDIGASSSDGKMVIAYSDSDIYISETTWTQKFVGKNDSDYILERHEMVEINVTVPAGSLLKTNTSATGAEFFLEVRPSIGATLPIKRNTPNQIDKVMVLN